MPAAQVKKLASHAQVDDQHGVVVKRQQQELAATARRGELATHETGGQLGGGLAPYGPASEHLDIDDATPDDGAFDAAANRLDFGKLGHLSGRAIALAGLDDREGGGGRGPLGDLLRGAGAATEDLSSHGHLCEEHFGVVRPLVGQGVGGKVEV